MHVTVQLQVLPGIQIKVELLYIYVKINYHIEWRRLMNFIGYRTLKTVIGVVISIYFAQTLNLYYATAAGIITILCLQSTRRQSWQFASKMIAAFFLALLLAVTSFFLFGFSPLVFGFFLLLFIPLSAKLHIQEGIVVSSVLITHMLVEQNIRIAFILNQLSLMGIGVSIALFLNLYMPSFENEIRKENIYIDQLLRKILLGMADSLRNRFVSIKEEELFQQLKIEIKKGQVLTNKNIDNHFSSTTNIYVQYMNIRSQQAACLFKMRKHFARLSVTYKQTILIAAFTTQVAESIQVHKADEAELEKLTKLRNSFTEMDLPKDRQEFENRSILYQFLNDMEEFLILERILKTDS